MQVLGNVEALAGNHTAGHEFHAAGLAMAQQDIGAKLYYAKALARCFREFDLALDLLVSIEYQLDTGCQPDSSGWSRAQVCELRSEIARLLEGGQ